MRTIKQRDPFGCGIACVAMVADLTYKDVMKIAEQELDISAYENHATNEQDIRILLSATNAKPIGNWRKFKSWDALPRVAIVAVNMRKSRYWHWVIFERTAKLQGVRDPKISILKGFRVDLGNLNAFKYLRIET